MPETRENYKREIRKKVKVRFKIKCKLCDVIKLNNKGGPVSVVLLLGCQPYFLLALSWWIVPCHHSIPRKKLLTK